MIKRKGLIFETIAIRDNIGYASDYRRNGLFHVDLTTGQSEYIGVFENEAMNRHRLHCSAMYIEDRIYFIPGSGNNIDIYYPESNKMEAVEIPLPKYKQYSFYDPQYKFVSAVKRENVLWLIPVTYPGVVKFDIITKEITVYNDWLENDEYMFRNGIYVEKNYFVVANGKNNAVLIFDMEKECGQIEHIGEGNNGVMSICKLGEELWFAPRLPGTIVSWNCTTGKTVEYEDFPREFKSGNMVFTANYTYDEKVIFVPLMANCALVYEKGQIKIDNTKLWKIYQDSTVEFLFETETDRYYREISREKKDRCFNVSKISDELREFEFYFDDDSSQDYDMVEISSLKQSYISENRNVGLCEFVRGVISD